MIILEAGNLVIKEILEKAVEAKEKESFDHTFADFDGVSYRMYTNKKEKNIVTLNVSVKRFQELAKWGAATAVKTIYGSFVLAEPEEGFDVSLRFDLTTVPEADAEKFATKISMIKRNIFGAPIRGIIENAEKGSYQKDFIELPYRNNESVYIKSSADSLTVLFSVAFVDPDDMVFAKVFLQEFADARRQVRNAPAVAFGKDPPSDFKGKAGANSLFVTMVLFKQHTDGAAREKTVTLIPMFRDYLHYHIKCAKAYMHTRMRARVLRLLDVLKRAQPEDPVKERKTWQGKTFKER